jgi:hypothetical protein
MGVFSTPGTAAEGGALRQAPPFVVCSACDFGLRNIPRGEPLWSTPQLEGRMETHDGDLSRAQLGARERASSGAFGHSGCVQDHPLAPFEARQPSGGRYRLALGCFVPPDVASILMFLMRLF